MYGLKATAIMARGMLKNFCVSDSQSPKSTSDKLNRNPRPRNLDAVEGKSAQVALERAAEISGRQAGL